MTTLKLFLYFNFTWFLFSFAFIALESAFVSAISWSYAGFVTADLVMPSEICFCDFIDVTKAYTAMATLHSNFADFITSSFWHFVEVFGIFNNGHVPMVIALELKLLQKVSSIV